MFGTKYVRCIQTGTKSVRYLMSGIYRVWAGNQLDCTELRSACSRRLPARSEPARPVSAHGRPSVAPRGCSLKPRAWKLPPRATRTEGQKEALSATNRNQADTSE